MACRQRSKVSALPMLSAQPAAGGSGLGAAFEDRPAGQLRLEGEQVLRPPDLFHPGLAIHGDLDDRIGRAGIATGNPGIRQVQRSLAAGDRRGIVHAPRHGRGAFRGRAARKAQQRIGGLVDTGPGRSCRPPPIRRDSRRRLRSPRRPQAAPRTPGSSRHQGCRRRPAPCRRLAIGHRTARRSRRPPGYAGPRRSHRSAGCPTSVRSAGGSDT